MTVQRHRVPISSYGREVFRAEYEFDYSGFKERLGSEWNIRTKVKTLAD